MPGQGSGVSDLHDDNRCAMIAFIMHNKRVERSVNHNDYAQGGAAHTIPSQRHPEGAVGAMFRSPPFHLQPAGRGIQFI